MPLFLTTPDLAHAVQNVITSAEHELLLLSPYLKFSESVRSLLLERGTKDLRTEVLCRRSKSFTLALPSLLGLQQVHVRISQKLHAKCYVNEHEAVIGSMNLHEHSAEHNDEMGFLVTRKDDGALFAQIARQAREWVYSTPVIQLPTVVRARPPASSSAQHAGFCIRCGEAQPFDIEKPLCREDHRVWARYEDEECPEEFCHACGDPAETSLKKPLCRACYRKSVKATA